MFDRDARPMMVPIRSRNSPARDYVGSTLAYGVDLIERLERIAEQPPGVVELRPGIFDPSIAQSKG